MLELKKKIISTYLEFAEKCQCESCVDCLYADAPLPLCEALLLLIFWYPADYSHRRQSPDLPNQIPTSWSCASITGSGT